MTQTQSTQKVELEDGRFVSVSTAYQLSRIQQRINPDTGIPYASLLEYQKQMMQKRRKDPRVRLFSKTILDALEERGQNQQWLSDISGVPKQRISDYTGMKCLPKPEIQRDLFRALDLPYNSINELVESDTIQTQEKEQEQTQ